MLGLNKGGYALPFEVVSMLLLAALVGCIVIAMRSPRVTVNEKEVVEEEIEEVIV